MTTQIKKILIYSGPGAGKDSLLQTQSTLKALFSPTYSIETVLPMELIEKKWESETALLVMPGGADIPYTYLLNGKGNEKIKSYVQNGGAFLGICAGSYYGGGRVEFALGSPLEVQGYRELGFFPGTVQGPTLAPYDYKNNSGARAVVLKLKNKTLSPTVYYSGGGCFIDAEQYSSIEILASYHHEGQNAAIVKCAVGKGVALLSAVHFEFDSSLMDCEDPHLKSIIPLLQKDEKERIAFIKNLFQELLHV